jgi:hypothetical protein
MFAVDLKADALGGNVRSGLFIVFWEHGDDGLSLPLALVLGESEWGSDEQSG